MTQSIVWSDADLADLRLEGLEYLNRLQSGSATEQDQAEFRLWRETSAAHGEAFRAAVLLQQLVRAASAPKSVESFVVPDGGNVIAWDAAVRRQLGRRSFLGGALAASVAGAVVVGQSLDLLPTGEALRADYRTAAGQRRVVHLAGGGTIDLNTRTSIRLRPDIARSAVELITGEAIMTSVVGGHATLVAGSGTSISSASRFSVRREGEDVCVTCLAGSVDVVWADEKRLLKPLDQVRYDGGHIDPVTRGIDPQILTAWQSGTLIFHDMTMREVVAEINRYRPGKVFLANDALAARPLSGTYYVSRLDEFFSQAQLGLGVKVTRFPGNVVILT